MEPSGTKHLKEGLWDDVFRKPERRPWRFGLITSIGKECGLKQRIGILCRHHLSVERIGVR